RAESHLRLIYAYDYDLKTGTPSRQRIFAKVPEELGIPDGATVDTGGGYWVALPLGPTGGGIGRFTPDGKLDLHIEVPVLLPTMVAFGGPDMSRLSITPARHGPQSPLPIGEMA